MSATQQEVATRGKQDVKNGERTRPGRAFVPSVDIYETADSLWLWADMPGVSEDSVDVRLADGVLTIEGRVSLESYENLTPVYSEYNVGHFERRFTLPTDIDADRISGRMRNGVLEVELPKAERAKPRRIPISTS